MLTLAGLAYLLLALLAARSFRREAAAPPAVDLPTVSILKPVKGTDPQRYAAFASHCAQQYAGRYELLLGLADPEDAEMLADVDRLQAEFPRANIRAVACGERLGTNGKVSTLVQMLPHALGDVIVMNDADIRVGPQYLQRIAAELAQPRVGMVTAPYLGRTAQRPGPVDEAGGAGYLDGFSAGCADGTHAGSWGAVRAWQHHGAAQADA